MQKKNDGATYAPVGKANAVVGPGEFRVGIIGLDHGHIFGMCNGLVESGAVITLVWDSDPRKVSEFIERFPGALPATSMEQVLESDADMIACASIAGDRAGIGMKAIESGKHFFADKPSITTLEDLAKLRELCRTTGKRFFTYFSERLHVEASVYAEKLIREGAIGRVVQIMGWGPHRIGSPEARPGWFWETERYGGILNDLGCHQIEQLLFFSGADDGTVTQSRIGNYSHTDHPDFQDFGDATLEFSNGVTGYFRVDWFTPDGLGAWGDGRTLVVGTDGYLEIRKYIDVANSPEGDHVYYVNKDGEHHVCASGKAGFPFFGQMILDCKNGTDTAMSQKHIFRVMELSILAQKNAKELKWKN